MKLSGNVQFRKRIRLTSFNKFSFLISFQPIRLKHYLWSYIEFNSKLKSLLPHSLILFICFFVIQSPPIPRDEFDDQPLLGVFCIVCNDKALKWNNENNLIFRWCAVGLIQLVFSLWKTALAKLCHILL